MSVERRDARLATPLDAAISDRTVRILEPLNLGVVNVDPDSRWHRDRLAIDEDVQMRMHVVDQNLLPLGLQSGCDRPLERTLRRRPTAPPAVSGRTRRPL